MRKNSFILKAAKTKQYNNPLLLLPLLPHHPYSLITNIRLSAIYERSYKHQHKSHKKKVLLTLITFRRARQGGSWVRETGRQKNQGKKKSVIDTEYK